MYCKARDVCVLTPPVFTNQVELDRNIVTLAGALTSAPMAVFSNSAGVSVWHFNKATNAIEVLFAASQTMWLSMDQHIDRSSADLPPTALHVGPVDGVGIGEGGTAGSVPAEDGPSSTSILGSSQGLPDSNETFCVSNRQRGLALARPTAALTATGSAYV